jgi:hypothetical protein
MHEWNYKTWHEGCKSEIIEQDIYDYLCLGNKMKMYKGIQFLIAKQCDMVEDCKAWI